MNIKDKKPKVLMVSTDMRGKGGVASVISTYINGGLKNNYNIRFLVTHIEGPGLSKLINFLLSIIKLSKYLVSRKCNVFHIHTASRSSFIRKSLVSWLGLMFGKKIILHLHGAEFMKYYNDECGTLMKWYVRRTFSAVDRVIVLSSQWKNNIEGISNKAVVNVIFNPVPVASSVDEVDADKPTLLFLGRIGERKGFWDILLALSKVKKTHSNFVFKYGGDGELDKAKSMIVELDLEDQAEYLGWVTGDEKQKILNESLMYLLPSYNEGLPIGILEAMASKVAVITCPVGGIPDVISNMVNGVLVPTGDVDALSEAIIRLLDSQELRHTLVDHAYNDIKHKFSVDVIVPEIELLYQSVLR